MIICCSKVRQSKFCPECGKPIAPSFANLVSYLEMEAARRIETGKVWEAKRANEKDPMPPQAIRARSEAQTFIAWADLLKNAAKR